MGDTHADSLFDKLTDPHPHDLEDRINRLDRCEFATRETFARAWKIKAERHALRTTYTKDRAMYRTAAVKWRERWTAARFDARVRAEVHKRESPLWRAARP